MPTWPTYGSNFSSGTTEAIGILVEAYNDLEIGLQFILLSFMRGKIWRNHVVTEHMSSTAVVEAIRAYLMEHPKRSKVLAPVEFALNAFETCRVNRNNIIHFGMAWRKPGQRISRVMRVKLRAGRFMFMRTLKVSDVRGVADDCHALKLYMDYLSVELDKCFSRKPFMEPERPEAPKLLAWQRRPY